MKLFSRKTKRSSKQRYQKVQQTYQHHWDHPKAYTIALLLIIGMLIVPIYTGFAVKDKKAGQIIFADSPAQEQPALRDICADTDGRDYNTKGTVSARSDGGLYTFEDSCSGNILKEYYCNGGRMASEFKKCANGCSDGKCR